MVILHLCILLVYMETDPLYKGNMAEEVASTIDVIVYAFQKDPFLKINLNTFFYFHSLRSVIFVACAPSKHTNAPSCRQAKCHFSYKCDE